MEIGNGIAIAGMWVFVGIAWGSGKVSCFGAWLSFITACVVTYNVL